MLQVMALYATGAGGTESALAQIDIPGDGYLTGVEWAASGGHNTTGDTCTIGLSFSSSEDLRQNDVRSLISAVQLEFNFVTSGGYDSQVNRFTSFEPGVPVFAGERVYIHQVASTGVQTQITCLIHLDTSQGVVGSMRAAGRRR